MPVGYAEKIQTEPNNSKRVASFPVDERLFDEWL